MSDNKKYYYLKLKENFFDTEELKLLENLDNGYLYSNILLKIYLKSLKHNGRLMFKERIPYNAKMIATVTGHNVVMVEKALSIFREMDLIEILDNGTIYVLDIQNFIGKSSTEADRIRIYREQIKEEAKALLEPSVQMYDKSTPEIELELEKDIEIKKEKDSKTFLSDSNEYRLSSFLFNYIKKNNPDAKEPNINNWSKEFDKILRIDKREIDEVKEVIKWCQNDSFWCGNILSPMKLRKQYDRLIIQMRKGGKNGPSSNNNENESSKYDFSRFE